MTVVHVLEPFVSGVCSAVITITEQLPEMRHVVAHGRRALVDTIENMRGRFPPRTEFVEWESVGREISLFRDFRALKELIAILRPYAASKETVIHLHSSKAGFLGRAACAILGIPRTIYTPHCASFIRGDIGPLKRFFFRCLERVGGALGGKVVGCGKSEALLYSGLGRGASWVSNGVRIGAPAKDDNPRLVSFSGVISPQKDPALFNELARAFGDQPFCWIGDGPLREKLDAKNIAITGWADAGAVNAWLEKTRIYLSASAWEGLPFGVLEAMNKSCALLLRDVPGNRDLVLPGENGYLFRDGAEGAALLKAMLEDTEKTAAMGRRSREMAEQDYSAEKMGAGYRAVYAAIMEGKDLHPWV
jgi:glycosyltransferase involved in cell wall biosynthesis